MHQCTRKSICFGISFFSKCINAGSGRIAKTKHLPYFIECLTGGIIFGIANRDFFAEFSDEKNTGMTATHDKRDEWKSAFGMFEHTAIDMSFDMMNRNHGNAEFQAESFCKGRTHKQCAGKSGLSCHGNGSEILIFFS